MERYFFVDEKDYSINDTIKIDGIEHNHISKVLRMKIGDKIVCLPNNNMLLYCEIIGFTKQETQVKIIDVKRAETECKTNLTVYVPLLKSDKFEFLITKLTELGVKKIIPFNSQFMTAKKGNDKSDRYLQIAKDACKQCRRAKLIEIDNIVSFEKMCEQIKIYEKVVFAYENERENCLQSIDLKGLNNIAMIVGSEGGFSEDEAEKIVSSGASVVSLGKRILRAETAVVTLAGILQYKLNEI